MKDTHPVLRPLDVAVLLHVHCHPEQPFAQRAAVLGLSTSTVHASVARLVRSGLLYPVGRERLEAATGPMVEFLLFGVPYAFPANVTPKARGVPTGLQAAGDVVTDSVEVEPVVWPSRLGQQVGIGLQPLLPSAPDIALRDPLVYERLALVDAIRFGDTRTREIARDALRALLAGQLISA